MNVLNPYYIFVQNNKRIYIKTFNIDKIVSKLKKINSTLRKSSRTLLSVIASK